MSRDIERFLGWYLNPLSRMKRGFFNILVFALMLPPFFLPDGGTGIMSSVESLMGGSLTQMTDPLGARKEKSVAEIVKEAEDARASARQLDVSSLYDSYGRIRPEAERAQSEEEKVHEHGFNWAGIYNLLMFAALFQILRMRLRDMGKIDFSEQVWMLAPIYLAALFDFMGSFLGIDLPFVLTGLTGFVSFILLGWVCMAPSSYIPPSERL